VRFNSSLRRLLTVTVMASAAVLPTAGPAPAWTRSGAPHRIRPGQSAAVSPRVRQGFAGVVVDEPTWPNSSVDLSHQLDVMVASGVESIRVVFDWAQTQPYATWNEVPTPERPLFEDAGGVPTDFSSLDQLVGLAAQRRLTVLPEILDAPAWDARSSPGAVVAIPRSPGPYAAFGGALVMRYGPHGTFWSEHPSIPKVPITMWQIWNEPNISQFWPQPFAASYVALLRAAHDAIKRADRSARVVLAGLPNYSWLDLSRIYGIRGSRSLFDVVAVHPFTRTPADVITILTYARTVMDQAGDWRKPILADEVSWPSARGQETEDGNQDFVTTRAVQARDINALIPMLAGDRRRLRLLGFYYYNWAGFEQAGGFAFEFSGLFRFQSGTFIHKPAFDAYKRATLRIEGCRAKGPLATSCER
jgi:polysaccharide biosynthesis protein PslG